MFAQYKDELGHVLRQSAEKLSVAGGYADDPARALDLLRECDGLLGQAGDLAKQLDVEVRSAAPNDKKALQDEAARLRAIELARLNAKSPPCQSAPCSAPTIASSFDVFPLTNRSVMTM